MDMNGVLYTITSKFSIKVTKVPNPGRGSLTSTANTMCILHLEHAYPANYGGLLRQDPLFPRLSDAAGMETLEHLSVR